MNPPPIWPVQAKLAINQPGDRYEQEADRVAEQVMRMPASRTANRSENARPLLIQRTCPKCKKKVSERRQDEEDRLQMKPVSWTTPERSAAQALPSSVPPIVHEVLRSPGQPLNAATRAFMEPRFGHDFSKVKVHADSKAAESAQAVNALAYTVGRDLVFGGGQYVPQEKSGQRLLAHELTHVLQQSATGSSSSSKSLKTSDLYYKGEQEAEAMASSITEGHDLKSQLRVTNGSMLRLQRLGDLSKIPPGMKCTPAPDDPAPTMFKFDFLFGNEGSRLSAAQEAEIDNVVMNWWFTYGDIRVDGYASTKGRDEINWPLSCDRALAVVNRLQNPKYGLRPIPADAIKYFAHGETDEFVSEELNRRAILSVFPDVSVPPTPPASSFNHSAASDYARKWALSTNPIYGRFGNDCTNFVSQAMLAGGWTMVGGSFSDRTQDNVWWFGKSPLAKASYTWGGAQNFANFVSASGRGSRAAGEMDLVEGDVLQMIFPGASNIGHSMVVTGKSATELLLSYHTGDHLNEPLSDIKARNAGAIYIPWRIS